MNTFNCRTAAAIGLLATAMATSSWAVAQGFPDKPVKLVLPFPVGGGADVVSRVVAEKLSGWWGQSVIVDNKPGASGFIAAEAVKRAPADGYTLLVADAAIMALSPHLYKRLPYDPVKDFDPIAPMYSTHFFVTVPANSPMKNVADLIAAAKAANGSLTYASSGVGSHMHLGGAMLEGLTGTQMTHVPYKELSLAFQDVSRGDVAWAFGSGATTAPLYQSKKIKYLAIAAPQRHPNYPDIPTVSEAGGPPNFELRVWVGLYAPHGTPRNVIEKIQTDTARALGEPDVRQRLTNLGIQLWAGTTDDLKKARAADSETFKGVVTRYKISLD
jgi:tripartite-type tricarboxylate transporter receptor subunit TctC